MSINLDYINGYLNAIECINVGPNHGCDYFISKLNSAPTMQQALEGYYGEHTVGGKSYDPALWFIKSELINTAEVEKTIRNWFLETLFSPTMHVENDSWCINGFLDALHPISLTQCYLYRILVSPPCFYECAWDDILIIYEGERYLLHLGVSD